MIRERPVPCVRQRRGNDVYSQILYAPRKYGAGCKLPRRIASPYANIPTVPTAHAAGLLKQHKLHETAFLEMYPASAIARRDRGPLILGSRCTAPLMAQAPRTFEMMARESHLWASICKIWRKATAARDLLPRLYLSAEA